MGLSDLIMNSYSKTSRLMQRGCDFLGSETAILCGAMSWVSDRYLVSAISHAGGFGGIERPDWALAQPPAAGEAPGGN